MMDRTYGFVPEWLHRADAFLLRHYPVVWATRAHIGIPVAAALLVAAIATMRVAGVLEGKPVPLEGAYAFGGVVTAMLGLIMLGHNQKWASNDLNRAPEHPVQEVIRFALLLVWSLMVSFAPIVCALAAGSVSVDWTWHCSLAVSMALWFAATVFVSPTLVFDLPTRIATFASVVGVIGLITYAPLLVGWALGLQIPIWSAAVAGIVTVALNGLFVWQVFRSPTWRKFNLILMALAIPLVLGVFTMLAVKEGVPFSAVYVTVTGLSAICLVPLLPGLFRDFRDVMAVPEGPRPGL
jgi:hypothetical protein